jgi:hypothetical protein
VTTRLSTKGSLVVAAALCAAAIIATTLTGCLPAATTGATAPAKTAGVSALGTFPVALSAARTVAPDAEFLLVQTAQVATTTPPASWSYLFASKAKKQIYLVAVSGDGRASAPKSMGPSTLKAADYGKIPDPAAWRIDSARAYESAAAAYTIRFGKAPPNEYAMGMATFVPNPTSGIKPFTWSVTFAPVGQGAKPTEVLVDAKTGAVAPLKK